MRFPAKTALLSGAVLVLLAGPVAAIAWSVFSSHVDQLMEPYPQYRPLILARNIPEIFWAAQTPDELEAWLKPRIPAAMPPNLGRGPEAARLPRSERERLVPEADAYIGGRS